MKGFAMNAWIFVGDSLNNLLEFQDIEGTCLRSRIYYYYERYRAESQCWLSPSLYCKTKHPFPLIAASMNEVGGRNMDWGEKAEDLPEPMQLRELPKLGKCAECDKQGLELTVLLAM